LGQPAIAAPALIRARVAGLYSAALWREARASAREFSALCRALADLPT
jgi:hypothetical protein